MPEVQVPGHRLVGRVVQDDDRGLRPELLKRGMRSVVS